MKKKGVYFRVLSYTKRYPLYLILSVVFALTLVFGKVGGALQLGSFFSEAFIGKNFENITVWTVLILIGLVFVWATSHYLVFIASNSLATSVMHDIRKDIYERLVDLPIFYYKRNRTGEILSRLLNDIGIIETFFMNIVVELLAQPITVVAIVTIMITISPKISLYFFSIAPIIGLVLGGIGALVQRLSMSVQKNISSVTSHIQETIYGIEVIKGFGVEQDIKAKFSVANDKYLASTKKELKVRFLGTPSSEFLGAMGVVIILVLGAVSVKSGAISAGQIVQFIILAAVLSEPLSRSTDVAMVLRKLAPAAERVFEVIDSTENEDFTKPKMENIRGSIQFENVVFGYDRDTPVLKGVDLTINEGETIAVVGGSGAGKSTLASLIPAFYEPDEGAVKIDGKDIRAFSAMSIRRQMSLVTQENILFSGTIEENIRLSSSEATKEAVYEAARLAHAHEFISRFADGYQTMLGDKGTRLSGGEKQRIALARAVLRKPRILVLDEATSSLDAESEKLIQQAMLGILGKQTTIIIAHKLSTIMHADRIIVMDSGRIIETGSHQELIGRGGIYNKLFNLQLTV